MDLFDRACDRLVDAAANGHEMEVLYLLETSVDFCYKNYLCFRKAIEKHKMNTLRLLFEFSGVLPRTSMILECIKHDNVEALQYMISIGALVNVPVGEDEHESILDVAERSTCSQEIIDCLKHAGARSFV